MRVKPVFLLILILTLPWMWMARFEVAIGSVTIFVPTDFTTIQDAINNAAEGDTIFVHGGTYVENVIVNKAVSLVGENKATTFIDGGGVGAAIEVTADNVSVAGFTIGNGGQTIVGAGTLLDGVHYANISDNVIVSSYAGVSLINSSLNLVRSNYVYGCNISLCVNFSDNNILQANALANATLAGVYLARAHASLVKNNSIVGSNGYGLRVESSQRCIIEENFLGYGAGGGISVYSSPSCNISRNTAVANDFGILVEVSGGTRLVGNAATNNDGDGICILYSDNCLAQSNNASGNGGYGVVFQAANFGAVVDNHVGNNTKSGIYFYTCTNGQIYSNVVEYNDAGIILQSCPNIVVDDNEASQNARQGILLTNSKNSTISVNVILNNGWEGLSFQNSGNSTADTNIVCANAHFGIWLQDSPNVDILGSNVSSNGRTETFWDGIYLKNSNNSRILNSVIDANGDAGSRVYFTDAVTFSQDNITGNRDGLRIWLANNNTMSDNNIVGNLENGVNIFNSAGNLIFDNRFVNNTVNAVSQGSVSTWDEGYPNGGNYWSDYVGADAHWGQGQDQPGSDRLGDKPYTINPENVDRYPLMTPSRFHNLTLENATVPSNEVYAGWICSINVTVKNDGGYVESFNVTAYYGDTVIETRLASNITVEESFTASLTWNTSGLRHCNTNEVRAEVSRIPGESQGGRDIYDFGVVKVKMVGDVNGDGKVNILDVAAIATGFGHKVGELGYKLNYDMNLDYVINVVDLGVAAKNCGKACT